MFDRLRFYGQFMTRDPLGFVIYAAFFLVTVLTSLILHEMAHGYVALRCGDPTAKMMGRLSLDPRKHLDPLGTIFMFFLGIGWAKPVPVNPRNFKHDRRDIFEKPTSAGQWNFWRYRRDDFLVSIAGICMNLSLMTVCTLLSVVVTLVMWRPEIRQFYDLETLTSWRMGIGASIAMGYDTAYLSNFMAVPWLIHIQRFLLLMCQINASLAIFNLLPIPPLDGFHLLNDTVLKGRMRLNAQTFQIMQIVLIVLCITGVLSRVLTVLCGGVYSGVLWIFVKIFGGV